MASATAKFDLALSLGERRMPDGTPCGIEGVLEYASDLFDRATAQRLAARLIRLLEAAVAAPDAALSRLEILSAAERGRILEDWNATARALPGATLPELFAAQVRARLRRSRWCSRIASLSYAELDARSNRLAHHLQRAGGGPETVVGCCWSARQTWWWGFWPSSRPAAPICRWTRVSGGAAGVHAGGRAARVLVSAQRLLTRLPELAAAAATLVRLDADAAAIAKQPAQPPHLALHPAAPRLRHLHLRFHRNTQGRGRKPWRISPIKCGAEA